MHVGCVQDQSSVLTSLIQQSHDKSAFIGALRSEAVENKYYSAVQFKEKIKTKVSPIHDVSKMKEENKSTCEEV